MEKTEAESQINSRKRSQESMLANELSWKLKSKDDFYIYLDKQ